jgi:ribulose-5-phosphate 4-epimerase/fuculose-1-phosphate aldolase
MLNMEMLPPRPRHQPWISEAEWEQRLQMAACLRLFAALGWGEDIPHQMSVRLVSDETSGRRFLLNPLGLPYEEASAGKLVQVDADGHLTAPTRYQVDAASFKVLSQVHLAREDVMCVMQLQEAKALALSCRTEGLRYDNALSAGFVDRLGYVDFAVWNEAKLADIEVALAQSDALILRQRGIASVGYDVPSAFWLLWNLYRACEIQLLCDQATGGSLSLSLEQARSYAESSALNQQDFAEIAFASALKRYGIELLQLAD